MKTTRREFEQLNQILQRDEHKGECPVGTGGPAGIWQPPNVSEFIRVWSPRAGGVFIAGHPLRHIAIPDAETRKRVSSWIWGMNTAFGELGEDEEAELPELTPGRIGDLAKRPALTVEQRIDRALRVIGRPPRCVEGPHPPVKGRPQITADQSVFMAATECGAGLAEMNWLQRQLEAAGLVDTTDSHPDTVFRYVLTLKGLNRLETGGDAVVSNTAFVAMWFNDQQMKAALEKGIAPAIREAGYEPLPINWKEHSNKICDEIVAEIRRARFLVCDFTCGLLEDKKANSGRKTAIARGGVYYEAGFAHGLGKKVIWTCRSDLIDHVHFDLRQYNTILWEDGKEDEFRQALLNRIRAEIA